MSRGKKIKKSYVLFFLILVLVSLVNAHQPKAVGGKTQIDVIDPEVSKAYYGELKGDAHYYTINSDIEFEIMKEDIKICRELGIDGVVFGILKQDGHVDIERNRILVEQAWPMSTTFHRAFDQTLNAFRALEDIIELKFDRILTAGQQNKVTEGLDLIISLMRQAKNRVVLMPGSGITPENIREIRDLSGAHEFHLTGRKMLSSKMNFRKKDIYMGGLPQIPEYDYFATDPEIISKVVKLVSS